MEVPTRIILVDNDYGVVSALKTGLERKGFSVSSFTSPLEALSNFEVEKYDLALLDIDMPEMDGLRLAQELLRIDNRLRICFLTAYGSRFEESYREKFPGFESYCYLEKPITIAQIVDAIHNAVAR